MRGQGDFVGRAVTSKKAISGWTESRRQSEREDDAGKHSLRDSGRCFVKITEGRARL